VRVRDVNNCSTSGSVTLTQPVALDATITAQTNVACYGNNTGTVTVVANPATVQLRYQYSIDGGGTWFASELLTILRLQYTLSLQGCQRLSETGACNTFHSSHRLMVSFQRQMSPVKVIMMV